MTTLENSSNESSEPLTVTLQYIKDCYDKRALCQDVIDSTTFIPLVGAKYLMEVWGDKDKEPKYFLCAICLRKLTFQNYVLHLRTTLHKLNFCVSILT